MKKINIKGKHNIDKINNEKNATRACMMEIANSTNNMEFPHKENVYNLTRDAVYDANISYSNEGDGDGSIPGYDIFIYLSLILTISCIVIIKVKLRVKRP